MLYARRWSECAEDVVQEAFVKLSEQDEIPRLVRLWLYRVVRNVAISSGRTRHRRRNPEARGVKILERTFRPVKSAVARVDGA